MNDINNLTLRSLVNYINVGNFTKVQYEYMVGRLKVWKEIDGFGECNMVKDTWGNLDLGCDYMLSARQCVIISATINFKIQVYVINRILELSSKYEKIDYITPDWDVSNTYNLYTLLSVGFGLEGEFHEMEESLEGMFTYPEFGVSTGMVKLIIPLGGMFEEKEVQLVTPKQAMIAAGQVSMAAQMYIIDLLHILEVKHEPNNVLQEKLPEAMRKLEAYTNHQVNPHEGKGSFEEFDKDGTRFYFEEGFYINTIFLGISPRDGVKVFEV